MCVISHVSYSISTSPYNITKIIKIEPYDTHKIDLSSKRYLDVPTNSSNHL